MFLNKIPAIYRKESSRVGEADPAMRGNHRVISRGHCTTTLDLEDAKATKEVFDGRTSGHRGRGD
jgi:hypothetical protein